MEERALVFAGKKHEGQKRKFSGEDYINHPIRVRDIVKEFCQDEVVLCAALLHDTREDTNTTGKELRDAFGWKVADMVYDLTNKEDLIALVGKTEYLCKMVSIMCTDSLLVKLADRLDNVCDLAQGNKEWSVAYAKQTQQIIERSMENPNLNENHRTLISRIKLAIELFI